MPAMSIKEQKRLERFQRLHPPLFHDDTLEDAHDFLDRCHQMLCNLGFVESNGVDLTIFQLRGAARRWW